MRQIHKGNEFKYHNTSKKTYTVDHPMIQKQLLNKYKGYIQAIFIRKIRSKNDKNLDKDYFIIMHEDNISNKTSPHLKNY